MKGTQMKDNETGEGKQLGGCGVAVLITGAVIILGLAAAVIFVLLMFGSWLGGQ